MPPFASAAFSICLFHFPLQCCQMKNNSGQEVQLSDVLEEQPKLHVALQHGVR